MTFDNEGETQHVTDRASYNAVAKAHEGLSKIDRDMMIIQLNNAYGQYEIEVVQIAAFRQMLYKAYNHKVMNNQSIAVLSRDFNMSMKGHNTGVAVQLATTIAKAYEEERAGYCSQSIKTLLGVGLSMNFLTSDEVITLLRANDNSNAKTALSLLRQIVQYQEALFKSVIWLATKVAKRTTWQGIYAGRGGNAQWKRLSGDVIEEADMIQEAIIAAKQAVSAYKPGLHNGQSFTSFIYSYVSGMLSKFINENTRVVAIPRKVMDRFLPLQAVLDNNPLLTQYGQYDYEAIAQEVSDYKGTPYSAVEVEWLLLNVSRETASLDLEVIDDNDGTSPITLGESLINHGWSQESLVDKALLKERTLTVIRDYTCIQEFTVLKIRWGGTKLLSLDQTAKAYTRLTELDMNKGKVAKLEQDVFQRLREVNDPRFAELLEVLNDSCDERQHAMVDIQDGVVRCGGRRMV